MDIVPSVTVILPVFNAEPFLAESINSILNQSFKDFELLIINDGSTDNSEAIIQSFQDDRIVYIKQENAGVAITLNNAIAKSRGKFIWRHDADDISTPNKLERQVAFLESNPDYALCATQIAFMTESGKIAWKFRQPKNEFFDGRQFVEVSRSDFRPYSPITHATVLMRKNALVEIGCYRSQFITSEDVDLWLRLLLVNKLAVLNTCDYFVRLNKMSATSRHGWRNGYYRNLALMFYDQRLANGTDELERSGRLDLPNPPLNLENSGIDRSLIDFYYPLYINARDWKGVKNIIVLVFGKLGFLKGIKELAIPIINKKIVKAVVKFKARKV